MGGGPLELLSKMSWDKKTIKKKKNLDQSTPLTEIQRQSPNLVADAGNTCF